MFFSVIVPIYNVEKYLPMCLDTIIAQSFEDFELILVDDGSKDNCPQICDTYAARDARVKVIHKENGGLVSARQAGIRAASGEYVFHVDGDDALCANVLEKAHNIISATDADIVSFSYYPRVDGKMGAVVHDIVREGLYNKAEMEEEIYPKLLSDVNMEHMFYFLWGRAIRRTLAEPHQLRVNPAISLGEDLSCIVPCFLQAESVYVSREPGYIYTIRNDSISTDFKTQQVTQIADVISGLYALEMDAPDDFEAQIARYSCFMCFAILAAAAEGKHFKAFDTLLSLLQSMVHNEEIPKAKFEKLSFKSRIGIALMQKQMYKTAFNFLYLCKVIKDLKGKGDNA